MRKVRAPKDTATGVAARLELAGNTVQGLRREPREPEEQWNRENVRDIDLKIVNEKS